MYRQGDTLCDHKKHWFRAKSFQQYRLFYRFNSDVKVIVLAWVNDDKIMRAFGSRADAYASFKEMLDDGNPPDGFDVLMKEAVTEASRFRKGIEASPSR